jgi:hypothetical protein
MSRLVPLTLVFLSSALPASAATLSEAQASGGAFSANWATPTTVGAGVEVITGTGKSNVYDNFVFTSLPTGAQTLHFDFSAPRGHGNSYSAGGVILYSANPFRYAWDGKQAGHVQLGHTSPIRGLDLDLGEGFGGSLYLAMNFTHGTLGYTINVPTNAMEAPAPVPLPAGLGLLASACASLLTLRRLRPRA